MKVEIPLKSKQVLTLDLLPPSPYPAFFIFSLHKAGSVLLNQIMIDITNHLVINLPSISSFFLVDLVLFY